MADPSEQCLELVLQVSPEGVFTTRRFPVRGMLFIQEAENKKMGPMGLMKITLKGIDLQCMCGNPQCTLKVRLRAERSGHHPPQFVQAHQG